MSPIFITEQNIKDLNLTWSEIQHVVEESMKSVHIPTGDSQLSNWPTNSQPARSFTANTDGSGVLLSMPGCLGNYSLASGSTQRSSTLACKLVTSFKNNPNRPTPLPNIMGTIFLFDNETGALRCCLEATEITAFRTAAASLVATKYLMKSSQTLAIIGCGVQGRMHAIAMCNAFSFDEIHLWNRTKSNADGLAAELEALRTQLKNPDIKIVIGESVRGSVKDVNVVCIATFASTPLIEVDMLRDDVHINAVGAGVNHHSELALDVYKAATIFVDNMEGARNELKTLDATIVGTIGGVIAKGDGSPSGITVFQSMGMAVEDAAVAQLVLNKFEGSNVARV